MNATDLNKEEKYFFSQNIFDEGHNDVAPPAYTAKDIEDARRKGASEGRDQAAREHEDSHARRMEKTLDQITAQLSQLLSAEKDRQDRYEQETLSLLLLCLKKLFPSLDKAIGLSELKSFISQTIKNQDGHPQLHIIVAPEIVSDIKAYISELKLSGSDIECTVQGDEGLGASSCSVLWQDGGALRNPHKLATDIEAAVQDILAGRGAKGHDENPEGNGENL